MSSPLPKASSGLPPNESIPTSNEKNARPATHAPDPIGPEARELQAEAHRLIPGGCHTYAKGDDQFPASAPPLIRSGRGCRVIDLDGREFIEYGMGLRAVTLGHAEPRVVKAASDAMLQGLNFTRPAEIEVLAAREFLQTVPTAEMVKFTKDGSTAVTAALKLARAATGRNEIAFCADHPFFSYDDWFIGTTAMNGGIPEEATQGMHRFPYGDLSAIERLLQQHGSRIAAVLLEPVRLGEPPQGYLQGLRDLCDRHGVVLIFDEMITGFRIAVGGAQGKYQVVPDLSTFGKALANGFALSALAGKRSLMELGGLQHNARRVFLLSTTHGAETHALAAARETMRIYREEPVIEHLQHIGATLRDACNSLSQERGMLEHVRVVGDWGALVFTTLDAQLQPSQPLRTLFLQELIRKRVIAPSLFVSYAHREPEIEQTLQAWAHALDIYRLALEDGVEKYLVGAASRTVYRSWNHADPGQTPAHCESEPRFKANP